VSGDPEAVSAKIKVVIPFVIRELADEDTRWNEVQAYVGLSRTDWGSRDTQRPEYALI
jgi:hypothetical protein